MRILKNFDSAKKALNGVVVFEGDWGGQVYLSCPMKYVKCSENVLKKLLRDIDASEWDCNKGIGTNLTYYKAKPGDGICGGMFGGVVEDELWIHPDIAEDKKELIKKVINGELTTINQKRGKK
ncbi:MAG: hypothetical protein NTW66_04150 [Candidatus Magasanikbacteria bacterium]|nr:hypothetical protein [Candidatus Magasanikbacteria bacterium]